MTSTEVTPALPAPPPTAPPRSSAPHRGRFVVVYATLAAVLGVAIAAIAIYAGRSINPAPAWSAWRPHGGGLGAAKDIADHVGAAYRLPSGDQLVDVIAKPVSVVASSNQQVPIHYIAITQGKSNDEVIPISGSDSVMYSLCGLGQACAISKGKPSVERGTLVRREVLELALYTFKYVSGVKNIVAFMPPTPGSNPQYAVYLQKSELSTELKNPLVDTLSPKTPLPSGISAREQEEIDATTAARTYKFSLSVTQTGDAVLVFAPIPA
ncbi:MAG TPA: hypothetical protein VFA30_06395 [Gaiellaceae bacterium]|nr:hypothetical protein [Gaiellaceae bacterium]